MLRRSNCIFFFISNIRAILKLNRSLNRSWASQLILKLWQLYVSRPLYFYTWWSTSHSPNHVMSVWVSHRAFDFDRLDKITNSMCITRTSLTAERPPSWNLLAKTMAWWDRSSPLLLSIYEPRLVRKTAWNRSKRRRGKPPRGLGCSSYQ